MQNKSVVFVCEHGAAKSIVAAAWFNKRVVERGFPFQAIARGTNPDEDLSPMAVEGLALDGITARELVPVKLHPSDLENAVLIVAFCPLDEKHPSITVSEDWSDVPAISDGYETSRTEIVKRIDELMIRLINPDRSIE